MKVTISVWDWQIRLFHWLLVLAVIGAYITGKSGGDWTDTHERLGGLILGLLAFRLIWGLIGTRPARFASFFPTLSRLKAHLKGEWQGVGHNPFGALAVIALLALLIGVTVTGLFANDDIAFEGPLYPKVSKALSDSLSGWHSLAFDALLGLIGLHLAAIAFYQHIKKIDLIKPMLNGKKQWPKDRPAPSIESKDPLHFIVALLISTSIVWVVWRF